MLATRLKSPHPAARPLFRACSSHAQLRRNLGTMANRYRGGGGMSLKPENALKRAEELIGVSVQRRQRPEEAMPALH